MPGIGPAWNDEGDYAVYTTWVEVQIILGKANEALRVLQPMLAVALEHQLIHRVIELSLLQACAFFAQGKKERGWKPLQLALSHAENHGYLRLVIYNPILDHMLAEAMKLGIAPNYIRRMVRLDRANLEEAQEAAYPPGDRQLNKRKKYSQGLLEPLSSREIEVLILMAQGLSNSDIAGRLYLSTNTLKAHTQNIYGKLAVHSRVQAVNKARELNLI